MFIRIVQQPAVASIAVGRNLDLDPSMRQGCGIFMQGPRQQLSCYLSGYLDGLAEAIDATSDPAIPRFELLPPVRCLPGDCRKLQWHTEDKEPSQTYSPKEPHFWLGVARGAVAALALLTFASTAHAGGCTSGDHPGQLVRGNMTAAMERRALHLDATVGLRPYAVTFRKTLAEEPRQAYALIPTDDAKGHALSEPASAALFWRQRRDCGVFDTRADAERFLRWFNEPLGGDQ